jgi:hypothetical protein
MFANYAEESEGEGMRLEKDIPWRSAKYLAWVRKKPCSQCHKKESVVHHIIGTGSLSGTGRKAPDWATMPLCVECHAEMHRDNMFHSRQWELMARTLGKAISDGILK